MEEPLIETGLHGHGLTLVIPPPEPIPDDTDIRIPPIRVEDLWDYVKQSKANDSELLKREYRVSILSIVHNYNMNKALTVLKASVVVRKFLI